MTEVSIKQLQTLMYEYTVKNLPFYVQGAPGIGKSDSARQVAKRRAKELGLEYGEDLVDVQITGSGVDVKSKHIQKDYDKHFFLVDVRVSQLEPADLRGIPFPEGVKTKWLTPDWLPEGGKGILFFDEINLAPPAIQASAYQLINERRVGSYILPDGWSIIAAGNREEDGCNVFPMSPALKNRFLHATLTVPTEEEWRDWAMESNINPDIVAFMAFKPTLLFKYNKDSKDNAFPTPRMWARASTAIDGIEKVEDAGLRVSTCVGQAAALEFEGFIKLKKKINLADILKNPKKVKEIQDIGLKYSLVSGLSEKYRSDKKLMEPILQVVEQLEAEFGVFLLRLMKGMRPNDFKGDLMNAKTWERLFKQYSRYLL